MLSSLLSTFSFVQVLKYYNDNCQIKDIVSKPGEINYNVSCSTEPEQTICQAKRQIEIEKDSDNVNTTCEPNGKFTQKQCNKTNCWCVNENTGEIISRPVGINESLNCNTVEKFESSTQLLNTPMPSLPKEHSPAVGEHSTLIPHQNESCEPVDLSNVKPIENDKLHDNINNNSTITPYVTQTCNPVNMENVKPHSNDIYSEKLFDRQTGMPSCNSTNTIASFNPHNMNDIHGNTLQPESPEPAFNYMESPQPGNFDNNIPSYNPNDCKRGTLNPNLKAGNSCDNPNNNQIFGFTKN